MNRYCWKRSYWILQAFSTYSRAGPTRSIINRAGVGHMIEHLACTPPTLHKTKEMSSPAAAAAAAAVAESIWQQIKSHRSGIISLSPAFSLPLSKSLNHSSLTMQYPRITYPCECTFSSSSSSVLSLSLFLSSSEQKRRMGMAYPRNNFAIQPPFLIRQELGARRADRRPGRRPPCLRRPQRPLPLPGSYSSLFSIILLLSHRTIQFGCSHHLTTTTMLVARLPREIKVCYFLRVID